jgi:hypothetical protein
MERIIVQVRDKEKAKMLLEFLAALDFVDSMKQSETAEAEAGPTAQEVSLDFFSLAGLWKDRDISLDSLRQKAWPRRPKDTAV